MRTLVRSLLIADLGDEPEIPAERWKSGGGIATDAPPRPFAVMRFTGTLPGMGSVVRGQLEVWIHDDEGDYGLIDKWLKYVKDHLDGVEHESDEAGNEIISCTWKNNSPDLFDDGYRTICKMAAFELVGKEQPA